MFPQVYQLTGLRYFHSTDLRDMRKAILEDEEDGPDGGSPHVNQQQAQRQGQPRIR